MSILNKALIGALTAVVAFGTLAGQAIARDSDGEVFVQNLANEATMVLSDGSLSPDQVANQFQTVITENTALRQFGRSALGPYSRVVTDDEFDQYIELLEQYAASVIRSRFDEYSGEQIQVKDSSVDDRENYSWVSVNSDVMSQGGEYIAGVQWTLIRRDGAYRVYDITLQAPAEEGTFSLLQTQREEFGSIIANNGDSVGPLLGYLRDRIREAGMAPAN